MYARIPAYSDRPTADGGSRPRRRGSRLDHPEPADVRTDAPDRLVLSVVGPAHDPTLDVVALVGDVEEPGPADDVAVVDGPRLDDFVGLSS
jgi:hypothetical protein